MGTDDATYNLNQDDRWFIRRNLETIDAKKWQPDIFGKLIFAQIWAKRPPK